MPLRKVTVRLTGNPSDQMALKSAFQIASRFQCRLDALFVWSDEVDEALPVDDSGLLSSSLMPDELDDGEPHYRLARRYFHAACSQAGFSEAETHSPDGDLTARLRKVPGHSEILAVESRASDLVVFAHHGTDVEDSATQARQAAISLAGRPALLCPPVLEKGMGETIMVAWNSTEHATRAIVGAMPLLCAAREVHLITIRSGQPGTALAGDQANLMVEYLRLHGVRILAPETVQTERSTAAAILLEAQRVGADLLVMGCSGKGRFSEFVLGSVSRDVIAQSRLPLLIAN